MAHAIRHAEEADGRPTQNKSSGTQDCSVIVRHKGEFCRARDQASLGRIKLVR
jgi:hypothetical protein